MNMWILDLDPNLMMKMNLSLNVNLYLSLNVTLNVNLNRLGLMEYDTKCKSF